jgi:hypothetical protein
MKTHAMAFGLVAAMMAACGGASVEPKTPRPGPVSPTMSTTLEPVETVSPTASAPMMPPPAPVPKAPVELASGQKTPHAIAVDASSIYWLTARELVKADKGTGTLTTLATGFLDPPSLVLDETNVYVASPFIAKGGGLVRVPKAGGSPTQLVKTDALAVPALAHHALGVDGANVYWTDTHGKVMSVAKAGGSPKEINSTPLNPGEMRDLAIDSSGVYWVNYGDPLAELRDGYLKGVPTTGGKPIFFLDLIQFVNLKRTGGGAPSDIALDADNLYWTDFGPTRNSEKAIKSVAKAGGSVTTLATMSTEPTGIALDALFVYWTTRGSPGVANGTVMKVSKTGGEAKALATGQDRTNSIAVDEANVYWTTYGGTVMKAPK